MSPCESLVTIPCDAPAYSLHVAVQLFGHRAGQHIEPLGQVERQACDLARAPLNASPVEYDV